MFVSSCRALSVCVKSASNEKTPGMAGVFLKREGLASILSVGFLYRLDRLFDKHLPLSHTLNQFVFRVSLEEALETLCGYLRSHSQKVERFINGPD